MSYSVKELFLTLQGEGAQAGRTAVFCRFTGCNLWSGLEADRATAVCRFCDTDFRGTDGSGGGRFETADALADAVAAQWPDAGGSRYVVCTGGEPALQLDAPLVDALHARGFTIAIETNGTLPLPARLDWICVSPKAGAPIAITRADELKLVFPQADAPPEDFLALDVAHRFLQPMDGPAQAENLQAAIAYCLADPRWRLSLQTHKVMGIP